MIYCPHCKKPSARSSGPCPHCKKELDPSKAAQAQEEVQVDVEDDMEFELPTEEELESITAETTVPPEAGEAPVAVEAPEVGEAPEATPAAGEDDEESLEFIPEADPQALEPSATPEDAGAFEADIPEIDESKSGQDFHGGSFATDGAEMEFSDDDYDEERVIEVQSIAPPPAAETAIKVDSEAERKKEIENLAGFGKPGGGFIADITYVLNVWNRRRELTQKMQEAKTEAENAGQRAIKIFADMGRLAREIGLDEDTHIKPHFEQVAKAEKMLSEGRRLRSDKESQNQEKLDSLEEEARKIEEAIEPQRKEEAKLINELEKHRNNQKRAQAMLQRAEIEIRNTKQIIAQNETKLADPNLPMSERNKLMEVEDEFEKRKPVLDEEIRKQKAELDRIMGPVSQIEAKLAELRSGISKAVGEAGLKREKAKQLAREFEKQISSSEGELKSRQSVVDEALATAGKKVMDVDFSDPELDALKISARDAADDEVNSEKRVGLIEEALSSYNRKGMKRGKKNLMLLGFVVIIALGAAVYFAAL